MPLGPYMIHCAVRLIGDRRNESDGRLERVPIGTGFCVRVASAMIPNAHYGYLLTAHHVIEGQSNIELDIPDPHNPGQLYPRIKAPFLEHPVERLDLALAPFEPPKGYMVTALQAEHNIVKHLAPETLLAAPFHYVGLLEPLNRMMARSGTLGLVDQMEVEGEYEYRTHLGDVRSYQGFSGSPCFVEYPVPALTPKEPPVPMPEGGPVGRIRYLHLLCGMFTGHLEKPIPGGDVSRHGVGYILSSDEIWDVLMSDGLREARRKQDAESVDAS
jgi:hypothetical protein